MNMKTISEEQFNDLVRERARNSKYSCYQTAWFSAKSKVERELKEKGVSYFHSFWRKACIGFTRKAGIKKWFLRPSCIPVWFDYSLLLGCHEHGSFWSNVH